MYVRAGVRFWYAEENGLATCTVGGDKEGGLWINRKKSDGVVEKCPEISYTKK